MAAKIVGSEPNRRPNQPEERAAILISYGPNDVIGNSEPIYEALHRQFGDRVLKSIDWVVDVRARLGSCRVVVPILQPNAEGGFSRVDDPTDPLLLELEIARARGIAILPVLVGGTGSEPLPAILSLPPARKPVRITEQNLERGLLRLIKRLEDILQSREEPRSVLKSISDRSALLLAVTFAILNYLMGAAPWIAAGVGLGILLVWVIADLWLVPRLIRR